MSDVTIRPFERSDREQVTALVNVHLAAILPGLSASTNTVLAQFEREPGEYLVDPWVVERCALVAEVKQRIVGATYLVRYGADTAVAPDYRGAAEIRWILCWPTLEAMAAGRELASACLARMGQWSAPTHFRQW
jgi:hypothetical protein